MKSVAYAGCGCAAFVTLVLLCPLLLLSPVDGPAPASAQATETARRPTDDGIVPHGDACATAVGCQQPVPQLPYVPRGFFPDSFATPPGECTSWAAALWPGHHGRGVTWPGDAWEWYGNAAAQGYEVSSIASVGAIVVFGRGSTAAQEFGHVAIVVGTDSGSLRVTEMNYAGRFLVDVRTVPVSEPSIVGYIPVPSDALP